MMRSIQRTLAILDSFGPERTTQSLQQIADGIGLPKSTTLRLLRSLHEAGYLVRLENQRYCLSFRFTRLAGLVESTLDIRKIARPFMLELARQTRESVTLNTVNGRERVCIDAIEAPSPLRSVAKAGEHLRLEWGATAKMLLAHIPRKSLRESLAHVRKVTGRTGEDILRELQKVARDGYVIAHEERIPGLSALSAPIHDGTGEVRYCITIAGPTARIKPQANAFLELLLKAGADISRAAGGAANSARHA